MVSTVHPDDINEKFNFLGSRYRSRKKFLPRFLNQGAPFIYSKDFFTFKKYFVILVMKIKSSEVCIKLNDEYALLHIYSDICCSVTKHFEYSIDYNKIIIISYKDCLAIDFYYSIDLI